MIKKILYADDNVVMLDLIKLLLESAGYSVLIANNPDKALEISKGVSLGVIILDVNLAGDSGLMLMNFMLHNHAGVPIILYTGGGHDSEAVDKMLQLGATKYVTKRNGSELVAAVKEMYPLG